MDVATARRLIALKSPIQARVDNRPRCQECGRVLQIHDFQAYWDGQDPSFIAQGAKTAAEYRAAVTPRICNECCDEHEAGRK